MATDVDLREDMSGTMLLSMSGAFALAAVLILVWLLRTWRAKRIEQARRWRLLDSVNNSQMRRERGEFTRKSYKRR